MNNLDTLQHLDFVSCYVFILELFYISICSYYTFTRILNSKDFWSLNLLKIVFFSLLICTISGIIKYNSTYFASLIFLIFFLSLLYSIVTKHNIGYCVLITLTSLAINYILFFISLLINFITNILFSFPNDVIKLFYIALTHIILLFLLFRIKRFNHGFSFLNKTINNEVFDILILNINVIILFCVVIISTCNSLAFPTLFIGLIIFSVTIFISIKKALSLYYKHKLLVQDLTETKSELEKANEKITQLEAENLNFSKTSHSIAHKQKALEYKLNTLLQNTEFSDELGISKELLNIAKVNSIPANAIALPKTNIEEIDNMLNFMQSECTKNNIDFELILSGNIHHIINTYISKEDLEILLADLIKNSIIAINNSDNINRSLLVKLGLFNSNYIISVYDSGIEFKLETLSKLGQKPCSTHLDNGGTGMGFMNIFDTLRKIKSSITINEINCPSKDNYTKFICITFDNKQFFKITSYRKEANSNIDLSKI